MLISAYRIVKTRWAAAAFDGEGARRNGGRWNSIGTRMVYTAESRSLAALEIMVHLEGPVRGYSILRCEFSETLVDVFTDTLSAPSGLAALGDAWIARQSSVVLAVPSAVTPNERNYLLNSRHPSFDEVRIHPPEPFLYDARLVKLLSRAKQPAESTRPSRRGSHPRKGR